MDNSSVSEVVEDQIKRQGVSCIRVNDGHVFTFTIDVLRVLLATAQTKGRVVVFVKHEEVLS